MNNKKVNLFNDKLIFELEESFKPTSHPEKYISAGKAEIVYVDEKSGAFMTVTKTEYPAPESVESRINEYLVLYRRIIPNLANASLSKKNMKSGKEIALLSYTSTSLTRNLMNYLLISSIENHEIVITMHCNIEKMPDMVMSIKHTLNSINIEDEGEVTKLKL